MENHKKKRIVDKDNISNLPGNIIDQILMRLPIKDAARTSVLSKNWKCKFTELPFITINQFDFGLKNRKFVSMVDHILFLHLGPILKLNIGGCIHDRKALDRWIIYLSRGNTKEFELELDGGNFGGGNQYRLPSCFYDWKSLTSLVLASLLLKLPSAFTGFVNLKTLKLNDVVIEPSEFEDLISKCPVLESLTVEDYCLFKPVKINAPNLQFLSGDYAGISFENTSHLAEVILRAMDRSYLGEYSCKDSSNLVNFLVHLPNIRKLDIDDIFMEFLVPFSKCCKPPISFVTLEYLAIELDLGIPENCLRALCFFKISPNLTKLKFSIVIEDTIEPEEFFWEDESFNFGFTKLQFVEITGSYFSESELSFVKFVLSNSPALEEMVINIHQVQIKREFLKDLLSLHRVSTARIICLH